MGTVVASGSLGVVMVRTLALNAKDVGPIPALDAIFSILITPMTLLTVTRILYKVCAVWLLNLPYICICM